jgi:hypothetical protein
LIFYTLQGPTGKLEIFSDHLKIVKKSWHRIFSNKNQKDLWSINELSRFEITIPKFLFFSGKIEWSTFNGESGIFRFSTNPIMVKKIEAYLQRRIIKNYQKLSKDSQSIDQNTKPQSGESLIQAA